MGAHRVYHERKYVFGQQLLTLRTRAALTQIALASQIGVHRRSVLNWETGESYPKAETLQRLIARSSWPKACSPPARRPRKRHSSGSRPVRMRRTRSLLSTPPGSHGCSPSTHRRPPGHDHHISHQRVSKAAARAFRVRFPIDRARSSTGARRSPSPRCTAGRASLKRCSNGLWMSAAGWLPSSGLAGSASRAWRSPLPTTCWPSLMWCCSARCKTARHSPRCSIRPSARSPTSRQLHLSRLGDKIARLVQLFRERRCLLILDNFESTHAAWRARPAPIARATPSMASCCRALSEREHQSCLLLTSREKPAELGPLEGRTRAGAHAATHRSGRRAPASASWRPRTSPGRQPGAVRWRGSTAAIRLALQLVCRADPRAVRRRCGCLSGDGRCVLQRRWPAARAAIWPLDTAGAGDAVLAGDRARAAAAQRLTGAIWARPCRNARCWSRSNRCAAAC